MGGTTVHVIEEIEGSVGGEGRGVESPSEPDTPSRRSYISSTDSGESGGDNDSDFELSDRDTRHDYEGYEEPDSDSDISTEEEEEEEEELRGRRHVRARSRRSGRRVFGGRRGRRRRGLGRASTSRSRSPIDSGAGEGADDGWVEDDTPLLFTHLLQRLG